LGRGDSGQDVAHFVGIGMEGREESAERLAMRSWQ
jgi:hypothetical protein